MAIAQDTIFKQPMTLQVRQQAQQFAGRHNSAAKARQVYLNTLAVQAVADYLNYFGFSADLAAGASWQPVQQALADVADLCVTNWGVLECRPVLADASILSIPPEVWGDRAAYVAVQFDHDLRHATILGFVQESGTGEIPLSELQATEVLLDYLSQPRLVRLTAWLQGKVAAGWQQLEDLALPAHELALNFRSGAVAKRPSGNFTAAKPRWVRRGKVLELSRATEQLALIVSIAPTASDEYDVGVDLCPVPRCGICLLILRSNLDAKAGVMQASARGTPA
ncbi:MAG: DUF1822 family protein, partial [Spirulinaceae cyanobacterium SM2_1_0]|nr:DUF1822 family protein [Spirulinaceae cyanobacterium SM2_1_0]